MKQVPLSILLATCLIYGADECALKVRVISDLGSLLDGVEVRLLDAQGNVVSVSRTQHGFVSFCDFGFGPHTVRVAPDSCLSASIEGVRAIFGSESTVTVIKNTCPHIQRTSGCRVLVRVRSAGRPVPNALLRFPGILQPASADKYGRIESGLEVGMRAPFTISAPNLRPRTLSLYCPHSQDIEHVVDLTQ